MVTRTRRQLAADDEPPPPPPPFPPPPSEDSYEDEDYEPLQDQGVQTDFEPWILRIRPGQAGLPPIVLVHVDISTTPESLSNSLQQICGVPVTGLVSENSGIFYSLTHILQESLKREIFLLKHRVARQNDHPEVLPWYLTYEAKMAGLGLLLALLFTFAGERILHTTLLTITTIYDMLVQIPLREMYRYGPYIIGWEGESLPNICARITYHGDASFWSRNMVECERIYSLKEEAFLRISRPIVYLITFVAMIFLVKWIVQEVREHRRPRGPPVDREMYETYRALNTLTQFFRRHTEPRRNEVKDRRS